MNVGPNSELDDAPIFLVGFMGAGKTTVGRALARHLDYAFFDLDELISARAGKSVQEIFADLGEAEFRSLESAAIDTCRNMVRSVVALGGGAYVSEENRASLRAIGKTVWLDCPIEICLKRISGDKSRPLLGDEDDMRPLLARRRAAYAQADYAVQAGDLSPEELAIEITTVLSK
jgi:shikimate kinase